VVVATSKGLMCNWVKFVCGRIDKELFRPIIIITEYGPKSPKLLYSIMNLNTINILKSKSLGSRQGQHQTIAKANIRKNLLCEVLRGGLYGNRAMLNSPL
jgi:hypothetical protein